MGIYNYNNVKYDVNEQSSYINAFEEDRAIPSGSGVVFVADTKYGYSSMGMYSISVLNGVIENIEKYNNSSVIYMIVKETYRISNGELHTVHKLINLGGYIKEKNKQVNIKHITQMYCGQLIKVEGMICNKSISSIKIKDLKLFKCVEYTGENTGTSSQGTYIEVREGLPPEEEIFAGRVFYDLLGS